MSLKYPCPLCSYELNVPDTANARRGKCPKCDHEFTITLDEPPFDPYHTWLGIPPDEQPPDHYRLLGVTNNESNADVISHAADRQAAHVRTFQNGVHVGESQALLSEIAIARSTLLSKPAHVQHNETPVSPKELPPASPRKAAPPRKKQQVDATGNPSHTVIIWVIVISGSIGALMLLTALAMALLSSTNKPVATAQEPHGSEEETGALKTQWTGHSNGCTITLTGFTLSPVRFSEIGDKGGLSADKYLVLTLKTTNDSDTKKVHYTGWNEQHSDVSVSVVDEFGNHYKQVRQGVFQEFIGAAESGSLYPGKEIVDFAIVELPVKAAKQLTIQLDTTVVEGDSVITFRVPVSAATNSNTGSTH